MIIFQDYNLPKDTKIGITGLLSNITTKDDSHKGGWTKLLRCQLVNLGYNNVKIMNNKDKCTDFQAIVFDLGAEYSGVLNLFGGLDEKCFNRVQELLTCFYDQNVQLFSWQHLLPDLSGIISMRKDNDSTYIKFKEYTSEQFHLVKTLINSVVKIDHTYITPHLLIGDSHTPSVWTPSMTIERRDGRTLDGMLRNNTINKKIVEYMSDAGHMFNELTFYAGNIDIRHHIMRANDPWHTIIGMVLDLEHTLKVYAEHCKINIVQALPIEDESRKLPKTGYYKKTPFFGKWNERSALHEIFNQEVNKICLRNGWQVYKHPRTFYNDLGQLTFDVMEKPQSVHISPMHYRWDLTNNKERYSGSF